MIITVGIGDRMLLSDAGAVEVYAHTADLKLEVLARKASLSLSFN